MKTTVFDTRVKAIIFPPCLLLSEDKNKSVAVRGQRQTRYLLQFHKTLYVKLLASGKLNSYLSDIDKQAEHLFVLSSRKTDGRVRGCS
jgi:hypothetical protein